MSINNMKKLTINIHDELYKALKEKKEKEKISMNELINRILCKRTSDNNLQNSNVKMYYTQF